MDTIEVRELYEINDFIPMSQNSWRIVRKQYPVKIGWICECGKCFAVSELESFEKHIGSHVSK